jgi:hypothetical protein
MASKILAQVDQKALYRPPREPVLVDVPPGDFIMVDGMGDPSTSAAFQAAVGALYAVSYPVVIPLKRSGRADLKVGPLEGLWWADDLGAFDPARQDRGAWRWTLLIRQPSDIPAEVLANAFAKMTKKVGAEVASGVRFEHFEEGRCAQLMHHGPYADEGPNIVKLHEFIAAQGLTLRGHHHEIYLSDPRRSAPETMRTILRQPVDG